MAYAFDLFSPARRFKRGMAFNEKLDFPVHKGLAEEDSEATDTDVQPPGLMPYNPVLIKYVLRFKVSIFHELTVHQAKDSIRVRCHPGHIHVLDFRRDAQGRTSYIHLREESVRENYQDEAHQVFLRPGSV